MEITITIDNDRFQNLLQLEKDFAKMEFEYKAKKNEEYAKKVEELIGKDKLSYTREHLGLINCDNYIFNINKTIFNEDKFNILTNLMIRSFKNSIEIELDGVTYIEKQPKKISPPSKSQQMTIFEYIKNKLK